MGTYKVDTDVVSSAVEKLIQLKAKCEEDAAITVPSSGNDSGNMHNKTEELCVEIKNTWKAFITLIDKSIDFLDKDKSTIETQDKTWSQGLQKSGKSISANAAQVAKNATISNQVEIDESNYNQFNYNDAFWCSYQNPDGSWSEGNGGCALTAAAYSLSRMGIPVDPLTAKERSGGIEAAWVDIADGNASFRQFQYGDLNNYAMMFKNDPNISPMIIKMKSITHFVVLKDVILDASGNIEKLVIFDPSGVYSGEHDSFSDYEYVNYYVRN